MALGDVEDDGAGFEEAEVALLIGGNLPERMQRQVRRLLHLLEGDQANIIGLADFFERPANAHVPRQSLTAIGRGFEGGDGGSCGHGLSRSLSLASSYP